MNRRIELQKLLEGITPNVYFQPPSNITIKYPAIIYSRKSISKNWANDDSYAMNHAYDVTVVDRNPDSLIVDEILKMKHSSYDRSFVSDGLNHIVIKLHY